eukprot:gene14648-22402_t
MPEGCTHEELPKRDRKKRSKDEPAKGGEEVAREAGASEGAGKAADAVLPRERPDEWWYEYLDHTADVQFHSWGATCEEMMELQGLAMFDYITNRESIDATDTISFEVTNAHNVETLLFQFMDELLFRFSGEGFAVKEVRITELDTANWTLKYTAWGEQWNPEKHEHGTEIKAITF